MVPLHLARWSLRRGGRRTTHAMGLRYSILSTIAPTPLRCSHLSTPHRHSSTSSAYPSGAALRSSAAAVQGEVGRSPTAAATGASDSSLTGTDEELRRLQAELLKTRLRLAELETTEAALYERVIATLAETDKAAHVAATELRYTGMALRCSHDNLEVELRRILSIGLTPGEIDAAAIEAGARQYVRQNIGFRAESVASTPAVALDVDGRRRLSNAPPQTTS